MDYQSTLPEDTEAELSAAEAEEQQAIFEQLRQAQTSKEELFRITSEETNQDRIAAAYRLLDLIAENERARKTGDHLYLEHDDLS